MDVRGRQSPNQPENILTHVLLRVVGPAPLNDGHCRALTRACKARPVPLASPLKCKMLTQ
jgi:hypothetical protein